MNELSQQDYYSNQNEDQINKTIQEIKNKSLYFCKQYKILLEEEKQHNKKKSQFEMQKQ